MLPLPLPPGRNMASAARQQTWESGFVGQKVSLMACCPNKTAGVPYISRFSMRK